MPQKVCPCCNRPFVVKRSNQADKKLSEDRDRAQKAIGILQRWSRDSFTISRPGKIEESVADEVMRLEYALADPTRKALHTIYRRADKGPSYVITA